MISRCLAKLHIWDDLRIDMNVRLSLLRGACHLCVREEKGLSNERTDQGKYDIADTSFTQVANLSSVDSKRVNTRCLVDNAHCKLPD